MRAAASSETKPPERELRTRRYLNHHKSGAYRMGGGSWIDEGTRGALWDERYATVVGSGVEARFSSGIQRFGPFGGKSTRLASHLRMHRVTVKVAVM